jgi:hypothetical protein
MLSLLAGFDWNMYSLGKNLFYCLMIVRWGSWESDIEVYIKVIEWEGVDLIILARETGTFLALVDTVMNLQAPYNARSWLAEVLAIQEGLCPMECVRLLVWDMFQL